MTEEGNVKQIMELRVYGRWKVENQGLNENMQQKEQTTEMENNGGDKKNVQR